MVKNFQITLILSLLLTGFHMTHVSAQVYLPGIEELVQRVRPDSALTYLRDFQNLGRKSIGDTGLDNTADWIIRQYKQWGYGDIRVDSFYQGGYLLMNIIVTREGKTHPGEYLVVDAHYDTEGGPGVNDNGSGTAAILETARVLAGTETGYGIKFIHFTAEEAGLIGSSHYVQHTAVKQQLDIFLVFNIDQVGGVAGMNNNTIICERDMDAPYENNSQSFAYTDTLASIVQTYSNLNTQFGPAYASDYIPFQEQGYVITGLFEANESPYNHTDKDSISKMDTGYFFEVVNVVTAATLFFSRDPSEGPTALPEAGSTTNPSLTAWGNVLRAGDISEPVRVNLYSIQGQLIDEKRLQPGEGTNLPPGCPRVLIYRCTGLESGTVTTGKLVCR